MGLGSWFQKSVVCPECRTRGAVKGFGSKVRCPNPSCPNYDSEIPSGFASVSVKPSSTHRGTFDPGSDRVILQYRNFRGESVEFEADRASARWTKHHVSVRVVPTGKRIRLVTKFVKNPDELGSMKEKDLPKPTPVERQILGYHKKHDTTSPRYEELRRKYPDWD